MQTQPLLFSEPSYSETAVWCELAEGIDPAMGTYLPGYRYDAERRIYAVFHALYGQITGADSPTAQRQRHLPNSSAGQHRSRQT